VTIKNSTLSGNSAQRGGALTPVENLSNATIVNNSAQQGGGIFSSAGSLGSIIDMYGSTASISNSVIANNSGKDCLFEGSLQLPMTDIQISINSNINNWFSDDSCDGVASGDPMLAVLSDNGGLTSTHALLPDSPLIDAGDTGTCLENDQRSAPRLRNNLLFQIIQARIVCLIRLFSLIIKSIRLTQISIIGLGMIVVMASLLEMPDWHHYQTMAAQH
jgi:hypothetical protein